MKSAIVFGGSGFVGSVCVAALRAEGWDARSEPTPRLQTGARTLPELITEMSRHESTIERLAEVLDSTHVVINSGGMATSTGGDSDALFGANALLPGVLSVSARRAGVRRFVQLSSIAVQGRMDPLDETMRHRVSSPYSRSRALGERIMEGPDHDHAVILRLPSVQGSGTAGNRMLNRVACSPLSSTAGRGDRPRPVVLPANVGAAVAFLASYESEVPKVVLQPTEGITTGRLLELLGDRRPRHIPVRLAKSVTALLLLAGRRSTTVYTWGRGLELMWLGQGQKESWLTRAGFVPPVDVEGWTTTIRALRST